MRLTELWISGGLVSQCEYETMGNLMDFDMAIRVSSDVFRILVPGWNKENTGSLYNVQYDRRWLKGHTPRHQPGSLTGVCAETDQLLSIGLDENSPADRKMEWHGLK